jgi:ABC-type transporter Mla maintaining outer membrane lipid asymmetry ATPase subunit MlaF
VALLHDKRVIFFGEPEEMVASEEPYIREFLGGS